MLEILILSKGRVVTTARLADLPYSRVLKNVREVSAAIRNAGGPEIIQRVRGVGFIAREPDL
jgi:DNA-binding response OmpR family regulator